MISVTSIPHPTKSDKQIRFVFAEFKGVVGEPISCYRVFLDSYTFSNLRSSKEIYYDDLKYLYKKYKGKQTRISFWACMQEFKPEVVKERYYNETETAKNMVR